MKTLKQLICESDCKSIECLSIISSNFINESLGRVAAMTAGGIALGAGTAIGIGHYNQYKANKKVFNKNFKDKKIQQNRTDYYNQLHGTKHTTDDLVKKYG